MKELKEQVAALPTISVEGRAYLSYEAVIDAVAAFLFPAMPSSQIDELQYQRILKIADTVCCELGYTDVVRLAPPRVPFPAMGLYWRMTMSASREDVASIVAGPSRIEELQSGRLVDARLSRHGLHEVVRQHFSIPVTVSDNVYDLMRRAVEGPWPNDWKGVMHDILGMCISGGKDTGPTKREFTVIIRGVDNRRYYQMEARLQADEMGEPYLMIALAQEEPSDVLFELGHVVATVGAAAMEVDCQVQRNSGIE